MKTVWMVECRHEWGEMRVFSTRERAESYLDNVGNREHGDAWREKPYGWDRLWFLYEITVDQ